MSCGCGCNLPAPRKDGNLGMFPPAAPEPSEEDIYDWEVRDSSTPFWQHATAGSCAGVMEHIGMYPIDTVKTRIQASPVPCGVLDTFRAVYRERGAVGLMRGSMVIGVGCVPAHVGLFGTYEFAKAALLDLEGEEHQPVRAAACGAMATLAHDAIITPTDVVKQRLQMGGYLGAVDCVISIYRNEGLGAFYRSLPTTLTMNIPYMGLLVASNESLKRFLHLDGAGGSRTGFSGAHWYFFTAGISGAFAAGMTLPLDVVKTRLQTQGCFHQPPASSSSDAPASAARAATHPRYSGILSTMRVISREEGARGFFRGLGPRVALAMPSAAICWGTYETIRRGLMSVAGGGATNVRLAGEPCGKEAGMRQVPLPPVQAGVGRSSTSAGPAPHSAATPAADSLEWEEWDGSTPFWQHAVAGSCAGMMEHVAMYPVDTIKTRMQAAPADVVHPSPGVVQTARAVMQEQGVNGLMRGCFAIGAGCIPAHIGLFCTYEVAKARLMDTEHTDHQPVRAAACGAVATVVHDMIITPFDVVKQRLQLGCYRGAVDCLASIWCHEGLRGFYRSLPTTLITECPFHGVLVASNESLKVLLGLGSRGNAAVGDSDRAVGWHFFSTGISGMIAAMVTQPLDVVKTRLQTQSVAGASDTAEVRVRYSGLLSTAVLIHREEGFRGLFRGTVPRLAFAAPSAAMCWGTYEVMKALLRGSSL